MVHAVPDTAQTQYVWFFLGVVRRGSDVVVSFIEIGP